MVSFKNVSSIGGDGTIPLAFNENVPKYDPSSFYNWEQDNIPIWVLEQRGDTLYRAMGFPGGNPEGVTFTLSSTGNLDESRGIYDTIEAITERIPKRLKFPMLIEICTYGNLGKLDLANITCEGNGKLEIKNKAYFEDVNASAYLVTDLQGNPREDGAGDPVLTPFITGVYSPDASSNMLNVSSTRGGTKFSDQDSWNQNSRIVCMQGPDTDRQANNVSVHVASGNTNIGSGTAAPSIFAAGAFALQPYDAWHDHSISARSGDALAFYGSSTYSAMIGDKRSEIYTRGQSTMFGFGNWFSSIKIKDCQGTIILRNILTDSANNETDAGSDETIHLVDYGWNIENSEVILDNTAAFRAIKAGYLSKNSRLNITGHFMGWRNYTKTGEEDVDRKQDGAGILAFNTHFTWDKTAYLNSRKYLNWFGKSRRGMDLRSCTTEGGISWAGRTTALPNGGSQLQGELGETSPYNGTSWTNLSGGGGDTLTTILNAEGCNEDGIYLEGCDLEFSGRINTYLNVGNGLHARRSQLRLPQITSNHNSEYGINLDGSQLTYGFGINSYAAKADAYSGAYVTCTTFGGGTANAGAPIRNRAQFNVDSNNQNVLVTRSSALNPQRMDAIPFYYGKWGGTNWRRTDSADSNFSLGAYNAYMPGTHFGATPYRAGNKPGFVVTNNSDMEIVNLNYATPNVDTGKGKVAIASNGSNMIFRGTSGGTTTINNFPITDQNQLKRSWLTAALLATDNSTCELTGPTKLARFGIPLLAEKSSQIMVKPPTLVGTDNILDVSGYTLIKNGTRSAGGFAASANHTSLEVHSTRACMVANKNSGIVLYGLGGVPTGSDTNAINSVDVLTTSYQDSFLGDQHGQFLLSTSGGYAKFYPNAFTSAILTGGWGDAPELDIASNSDSFNTTNRRLTAATNQGNDTTTGGMVGRAVGDSYFDVNLVNFYNFLEPSSVSGAYYNLEGKGCEQGSDTVPDGGGGGTDPGTTVSSIPTGDGWGGAAAQEGGTGPGGGGGTTLDSTYGNGNGANQFNPTGRWWSSGRLVSTGHTNQIGLGGGGPGAGGMYNPLPKDIHSAGLMQGTPNPLSQACFGQNRLGDGGTNNDYLNYMFSSNGSPVNDADLTADPACMGSQIQIWNIADTSRIHAANCLMNSTDPETFCLGLQGAGLNYHGPFGKWWNGVSLDYFGLGGRRSTYGALGNAYHNNGMFRLMLGSRGDLKGMYDVSSLSGIIGGGTGTVGSLGNNAANLAFGWNRTAASGGSPVDQINGAGYTHWTQNTSMMDTADTRRLTGFDADLPETTYQSSSCLRVFGWGLPSNIPGRGVSTMPSRIVGYGGWNTVSGGGLDPSACGNEQYQDAGDGTFGASGLALIMANPPIPPPPLNMDSLGFMRNWFDETASNTWQNVKHLAEDKVNGVSIYRSNMGGNSGGEGRDSMIGRTSYGLGVRSLNLFDLERLI